MIVPSSSNIDILQDRIGRDWLIAPVACSYIMCWCSAHLSGLITVSKDTLHFASWLQMISSISATNFLVCLFDSASFIAVLIQAAGAPPWTLQLGRLVNGRKSIAMNWLQPRPLLACSI